MGLPIDKQYLIDNMKTFKSVILDPAYIIQKSILPSPSADYEGVIYQYTGSASGMTLGGFYQCQEITPSTSPKTYHWIEITTKTAIDRVTIQENANDEIYVVDATSSAKGIIKLGNGLSTDTNGATNVVDRVIVASTMPTAAAALDGNVYLYCGTTTVTYQKGCLYKCQESSTTGVYEFVQIGLHADEDTLHTAADGELSVDGAYKKIFPGTKEEYENLSADEKKKYDYLASPETVGGDFDVYSTTETKTNKVWINGKPIYRKVISLGTLPDATTKIVNTGISDISFVISLKGTGYMNQDFVPLPYPNTDGNHIQMWIETPSGSASNIHIRTIGNWSSRTAWAIIEYTKATD